MANLDDDLQGIGGWLAFFLVTLGVITPLTTLFSVATLTADTETAAGFGAMWGQLLALEWTVAGVSIAGCWVAVWHFFKVRSWRTVRLAVATLWVLCLLALVVEPLGVAFLAGLNYGDLFAGAPGEFLRPLVYSSIWTAYLLKSVRVANTYPVDGSAEEIAEVFE